MNRIHQIWVCKTRILTNIHVSVTSTTLPCGTFASPERALLWPFRIRLCPEAPAPGNHWFAFYRYSFDFSVISYSLNCPVCSVLYQDPFSKHRAAEIHPYWCVSVACSFLLRSRINLYGDPFTTWWLFSCFQFGAIMNSAAVNIWVCVLLWAYVFISIW